jgi:hypothetical protein
MQNPDIIIQEMCICTGTVTMIVPPGGKHVRQVDVRIRSFIGTPTVVASIESPDSNGTVFCLWSTVINNLGTETQIVFSATNAQVGQPSDFTYNLSYIATGKIK